jgi:predicted glycoside hydrolase/deacetylase ChbG (UPF0249 family)
LDEEGSTIKRVIINADDFGLSTGINEGIIECYESNVISRISFIANTDYFDTSADLLKSHNITSIGVHLTLVGPAKPLSGGFEGLVMRNGLFLPHYSIFFRRLMLKRISLSKIECECRMQIERLLTAGFEVCHIDSHQHLHIFPPIADIVLRLAKEYNIRYVRCPYSEENRLVSRFVNSFSLHLREKIKESNLSTSDYFKGFDFRSPLGEQKLCSILESLNGGVTELMMHPGKNDAFILYDKSSEKRTVELKALLSNRVKEAMQTIELIK